MDKDIPEFLLEMSKQMNEQPNRCTSHPFWQVRCKRYLVTEEGYNESHWEICDIEDGTTLYHSEKDDSYQDLFNYLIENQQSWLKEWASDYGLMDIEQIDEDCIDDLSDAFESYFDPEWQDMPETLKKFHMQEIEEVVTTHLTQADAEWFIKRKKHDYPKLYTYVESAYWSPQLRELQDWIKSLTDAS